MSDKPKEKRTPVRRKDGAPYRPLTIPERDMLFALYEKHNGNMTALSRDPDCPFKAYSMIRYWAGLYNFESRLIENKRKRAEKLVEELSDAKMEAVRRAVEMVQHKLIPLRDKDGATLTDAEGQPIFINAPPFYKEVKAAWEIIKTELGEPTTISKAEVNNPQGEEVSKALDVIERLAHGKPPSDGGALSGERGTAGDTAEVPPPVQHDLPEEPPEK